MNPYVPHTIERTASQRRAAHALEATAAKLLIFGLAFGIFALAVPTLLLACLGASIVVFGALTCVRPMHHVALAVVVNYAYWVVSGFVSRGLTFSSLTSGDFWRGEGRCFFFYLPLLAISMLRFELTELRYVLRVICVLTLIGALLCGLWLAGLGHLFQTEVDEETGELSTSTYFLGLLTSHTGAGAFWATTAAFLLAFSLSQQDKTLQLLSIVAALLTFATGGRAATLGIVAVLAWLAARGQLFQRRTIKVVLPVTVVVVIGSWTVAMLIPEVHERMVEVVSPRAIRSVGETLSQEPTLREATGYFHSGANLEHHNLVIRVFLWKYAWHLFSKSPAIGIGFARYNDNNLRFAGVPGVASLAVSGERVPQSGIRWEREQLMTSTGNAHNSYLHMLAETGVLGFALFLYLWYVMYRCCRPVHDAETPEGRFELAYCHGCRAMMVSLMAAALAGHALAAPSGGVLVTTAIGAWLAYVRQQTRRMDSARVARDERRLPWPRTVGVGIR